MIDSLASLLAAQTADPAPPASPQGAAQSGTALRGSGAGSPAISARGRQPLGSGLTAASGPAALLLSSSPFPAALDAFTAPANDAGQATLTADLADLSNAARAAESSLSHLAKAAPGDAASRLYQRTLGLPQGEGSARSSLGASGGQRRLYDATLATPRRPVVVSLGAAVTVPPGYGTVQVSALTSLSSSQKSALGWTGAVADLGGLCWIAGAKLQAPDASTFAADDPALWDPAAAAGRCEVRLDDSGAVQLTLCPGPLSQAPDPTLFARSGGAPYLLPGLWYLWALFVLSAYPWL